MVPLIINPIYTLYSGYLLGFTLYDLFVTSFLCATMSIHCPSGQFGVMLCRVHTTDQKSVSPIQLIGDSVTEGA